MVDWTSIAELGKTYVVMQFIVMLVFLAVWIFAFIYIMKSMKDNNKKWR